MKINFIPTDEQQKVLNWISTGIGNAMIDAKAGSGKSSLIEAAIWQILSHKSYEKIAYFAFNKETVDKMSDRLGLTNGRSSKFPGLRVMTCHSFGYSMLKENKIDVGDEPDEYKYLRDLNSFIEENANDDVFMFSKNELKQYEKNIKDLLNYARYDKAQKPSEIKRTAERFGIIELADECVVVSKILRRFSKYDGKIDYTDMIWLPCELSLNTRNVYNYVFVDEAQDLSPIEQELVLKALDKRRGRLILVGDKDQNINAWCGADRNAFETYSKIKHMNRFTLSICQRCSKKVISEAQTIVPEIVAREDAPEGNVIRDASPDLPTVGDLVLCRYTLPLIEYQEYLLKCGKKSVIIGKNVIEGILSTLLTTTSDIMDKDMRENGVIPELWHNFFFDLSKKMVETNLNEEDVIEYCQDIIMKYDTIRVIEAISEYGMDKSRFIDKLNRIFNNEVDKSSCIILSTIHKSKGGEADNVFILRPSLIKSRKDSAEWELQQDRNLEYVMITRAKLTLNYMSEHETSKRGISALSDMKKTIDNRRKKLQNGL